MTQLVPRLPHWFFIITAVAVFLAVLGFALIQLTTFWKYWTAAIRENRIIKLQDQIAVIFTRQSLSKRPTQLSGSPATTALCPMIGRGNNS